MSFHHRSVFLLPVALITVMAKLDAVAAADAVSGAAAATVALTLEDPAAAVVVLVAAALCALAVFVLPAQRLWRDTRVRMVR